MGQHRACDIGHNQDSVSVHRDRQMAGTAAWAALLGPKTRSTPWPPAGAQMGCLKDDQRARGPREFGLFSRLVVIPEPNSNKNCKI
jgi:hypothetical protein